jgi:lipid A 4'-phosphatase
MPTVDRRSIVAIAALILLTLAVFGIWPKLDLTISAWFFVPGVGFPAAENRFSEAFRLAVWDGSILLVCVALLAWTLGKILRRQRMFGMVTRLWGAIVLLYLLGPGLLVDVLLKRVWGRARPANIVEFGGTAEFTAPHQFSGECASNCSLPAGEVAGAMTLALCLLLIIWYARPRMSAWFHRICVLMVLALPLLTGLQRLAAGRHFTSDVILAVLLIALIAAVLSRAMSPRADGAIAGALPLTDKPQQPSSAGASGN